MATIGSESLCWHCNMAPECYQCFTNCPIKEGNFSRCDFAKLSACACARVACQANKIALNWIKTEHWLTCKKCAHQLSGASCSLIARCMIQQTIKYFSSFSKLTMWSKMQCNTASGHKTTARDWNQGKNYPTGVIWLLFLQKISDVQLQ